MLGLDAGSIAQSSPSAVIVAVASVVFVLGLFDSVLGRSEDETQPNDTPVPDIEMADESGEQDISTDSDYDQEEITAVEQRIEQMEDSLGELSSTVSTVRSENEEISNNIKSIEEDIRELLGIYKHVTQHANPFIDQEDMAVDPALDAEVGLFESDSVEDDSGGSDEIMEKDAEEFLGSDESENDSPDPDMGDFAGGDSWDEVSEQSDTTEAVDRESEPAEESINDEPDDVDLQSQGKSEERPVDDTTTDQQASLQTGGRQSPDQQVEDKSSHSAEVSELDGSRPYIDRIPPGYEKDQLALQWVNHLLSKYDRETVGKAFDYYEKIGWIGSNANEHMKQLMQGIGDDERSADEETEQSDTVSADDHAKSLEFIAMLDGQEIGGVDFD